MEFCPDIRRALKTDGWMSEAELQFLAETATKSKLVYEIGSFAGRSTRALGDNCRGLVHAIDSWDVDCFAGSGGAIVFRTSEEVFNHFYCNMHDLLDSGKVIPSFCNWEDFKGTELADFIFIDGDHRYESVRRDIDKAMTLIKPGGTLAGHDYVMPWEGVVKAVDETFPIINKVDSIWWVRL